MSHKYVRQSLGGGGQKVFADIFFHFYCTHCLQLVEVYFFLLPSVDIQQGGGGNEGAEILENKLFLLRHF